MALEAVEWVIDDVASCSEGEDEIGQSATKPVRKIPRFNEQESLAFKIQRKLKPLKNPVTEALMKKSIIQPGFEQLKNVPTPVMSRRALRRERKIERERTKGPGWYNLPVQEMTEEIKNDVDLLRMRSILDKKHFYKKNDISHVPKYFQMGTVLEGPADFYNGRIVKSQRKKTLLGELMADAEARESTKSTYKAIVNSTMWKKRKKSSKNSKKDGKKKKDKKNKKDM